MTLLPTLVAGSMNHKGHEDHQGHDEHTIMKTFTLTMPTRVHEQVFFVFFVSLVV